MLFFALFQCVPNRAHITKAFNHLGNDGADVVNLFHCIVFTNGKTEGAVGNLVGKSDGEKDVAGVKGAGGAGRAGACADAVGIQHQKQAFALNALKAHIDCAGDMVLY